MSQPQQAPSNGLGVAGFVTSLVGLVMCGGLICPIGLLLSTVALFKRPRGLAIAGFIIGLIGSSWIIVIVAVVLFIGAAGVAAMGSGAFEFSLDTNKIHAQVAAHYQRNSALPSTLAVLPLDQETLIDPWGAQYKYEIDPDGTRYTLTTSGRDGLWDTDDDYSVTKDAAQPY